MLKMLLRTLVIIVFLLGNIKAKLNVKSDEQEFIDSVSNCIEEVGMRFFKTGQVVAMYLSNDELMTHILLGEFFKKNLWSFIVLNSSISRYDDFKKIDNYVIQIKETDEIKFVLQMLETLPSWNPYGKIIVVSASIFNHSDAVVIMQHLWKSKAVKSIISLVNPKDVTQQQIFTWYPYANGNCGNHFDKIIMADKCRFGRFEKKVNNWFDEQIPKKLNNCPLRVRVAVWPPYVMPPSDHITGTELYNFSSGIEIQLMNTIAEKANIKVMYTMSDTDKWSSISANGTMTGAFLQLSEEKADVAMSSLELTEQRLAYFDISTPYIMDSLLWCVPHSKSQPPSLKFLNTMTLEVWCAMLTAFPLFCIIVWSLSRYQKIELHRYKSIGTVLQNVFGISLGVPIKTFPRTYMIRVFLGLWISTSLIIQSSYTTYMMSVLTGTSYVKQIKTLDEIFKYNLQILLMPNYLKYFNGTNWNMQKVVEESGQCNDINQCLQRVAFQRDSAVCVPKLYLDNVFYNYVNSNKDPLLYCFDNNIVAYPINMYMIKGFPLKNRINELIGHILAGGFLVLWEKRIFNRNEDNSTIRTENAESSDRMKLVHLHPIFILLIMGHIFAVCVFLLEISVHKFKIRAKRKFKGYYN